MGKNTEKLFTKAGGSFIVSFNRFQKKASKMRACLFDWDGVFNSGQKSNGQDSAFNERDSMGINLLRFSHWLQLKSVLPVGIISGERNDTSRQFALREHVNAVYLNSKDKRIPFDHFLQDHNCSAEEVAFFFDDVLDLAIAKDCGLRIFVNNKSGPLFLQYILKNKLADYLTAQDGAHCAIREGCELILGSGGMYERVLDNRIQFSKEYQQYLSERNALETKIFRLNNNVIEEAVNPG